MVFHIFTIFPNIFSSYFNESILKRAQEKKLLKIKIYNIRDFAEGKHKITAPACAARKRCGRADEKPFGGGAGMVLKAQPIIKAVSSALRRSGQRRKIILLSAKGKQFDQKMAHDFSKKYTDIFLICGRYEGIDERVKLALKAQEISIGPYVLTDGEAPAMVVVSGVSRLLPGAIRLESLREESFFSAVLKKERGGMLEYPHYTRPESFDFQGKKYRVPKVLLSGNHEKIAEWRKRHSSS